MANDDNFESALKLIEESRKVTSEAEEFEFGFDVPNSIRKILTSADDKLNKKEEKKTKATTKSTKRKFPTMDDKSEKENSTDSNKKQKRPPTWCVSDIISDEDDATNENDVNAADKLLNEADNLLDLMNLPIDLENDDNYMTYTDTGIGENCLLLPQSDLNAHIQEVYIPVVENDDEIIVIDGKEEDWHCKGLSKTVFAKDYFTIKSKENGKWTLECLLCKAKILCVAGNNSNMLSHLKTVSFKFVI